jgi:5-methylthioadenosine/S-adenosylhomocysteine deaminase
MTKKINTIIKNAIVLTMDEEFNQYDPGAIAISGNSIEAVGPEKDILEKYSADEIIDAENKIVMPGLVNAHTHVPMTLLRGLEDDLRLDVWLLGYMMPVEREFVTPEFVRLGTKLGCAEFIRSGITSFNDMYYYEEAVAEETAKIGLRAVLGETIIKFPTPDALSYEDALSYTEGFIQRWKDHELIVPAVAPHAPYTATVPMLEAAKDLALKYDVPLHIHISETEKEVKEMRAQEDRPVVPYVKRIGLLETKMIAAHCVHIDKGEMHSLFNYGCGVAHNPSSNMKLASGAAPVQAMLDIGVNVGIGTDGSASNNDLDMFEEMRLAAFLAKLSTNDPTALNAKTAVAMATRLGANAIHLGDITGSLEPGKRADLILVDINTLHNSPRFKRSPDGIYSQLVYASKSTDVSDSMVNGKWLMRDQKLLTVEEDILLTEAAEYALLIDEFLIKREKSMLSKLIAIGGAMEQESFEVQIKVKLSETQKIIEKINSPDIDIVYFRHYHEYDTYFSFEDMSQGYLRHREDAFMKPDGVVDHTRARLTLIGQELEHKFPTDVMLSRSRYYAPATQTLRFLREYFKPELETFIEKDRLRWLINFKDVEFYINIDTIEKPDLGNFLEVKSRTWSREDAKVKADMISELIRFLGADPESEVTKDYLELVSEN